VQHGIFFPSAPSKDAPLFHGEVTIKQQHSFVPGKENVSFHRVIQLYVPRGSVGSIAALIPNLPASVVALISWLHLSRLRESLQGFGVLLAVEATLSLEVVDESQSGINLLD